MVALFRENTPRLVEDIHSSLARRNSGDVARSAHALLSSLGVFGAHHAHQLTLRLEEGAMNGDFADLERTFDALVCETAQVQAALASFTTGCAEEQRVARAIPL